MSRPVEYYIFDPGFPEIVITSATPRVVVFGETMPPKRRAKSQDPGLSRVPNREIGDKRANDTRALQGLLRRSPSTPDLTQKFAAKAPWALKGKGPARLDLSLWRSKKNRLPTEILTTEHISTHETNKTTPKQSFVTTKPPLPEIPTIVIDMNANVIPKARGRSFGNGKLNRESRLMENSIYHGDLEVTKHVKACLTAEEGATYSHGNGTKATDTLVD